jgi:L-2-hydroxyglutarate oxidase
LLKAFTSLSRTKGLCVFLTRPRVAAFKVWYNLCKLGEIGAFALSPVSRNCKENTMTETLYDVLVVGAGIVGLATAMDLTRRRPDLKLLVVDKEDKVASHQTGNNSGVIHAGIYYKPGSLKAQMSIEGMNTMIDFCEEHDLPYELCGKVIVALNHDELPRLEELYQRGTANGVPGLKKISKEEIKEYEPHCAGIAGLWSPRTGIVDYKAVARTYAEIIKGNGGEMRLDTEVTGIHQRSDELIVQTTQGDFHTRYLVNCAGLQSDLVAQMMGSTEGLRIVPFRGEYYELTPESQHLVRGLIYPVPDPDFPFLGAHFTKKIHGSVEAGPNAVLTFAREGYKKSDVDLRHIAGLATYRGMYSLATKYWRTGIGEMYRSWNKGAFVKALQKLVPEIETDDLAPGGAGIRAQAMDAKGNLLADFSILERPNSIHVLNAPSPAATASIPIGRSIADKALATFGLGA